jgi:hypothetical protein
MPNITLSEAVQRLRDANSKPEEAAQEIAILEKENVQARREIKGRLSTIKILRRLTGDKGTGGVSQKDDPESLSRAVRKYYMYLRNLTMYVRF